MAGSQERSETMGKKRLDIYWYAPQSKKVLKQSFLNPKDAQLFKKLLEGRGRNVRLIERELNKRRR
jgi:hypothetical protein